MNIKPDITALMPTPDEVSSRREVFTRELQSELDGNRRRSSRERRRSRHHRAWRGRGRLLTVLFAILVLGAGVATAAGVFSADEMNIDGGMGCYSEAKLAPEVIAVIGPVEDPVAACAEMWRKGEIDSQTKKAPRLVACTGPDQPVRVIPGRGLADCERLGLVELPSDYPQTARQWRPPAN